MALYACERAFGNTLSHPWRFGSYHLTNAVKLNLDTTRSLAIGHAHFDTSRSTELTVNLDSAAARIT